MVRILREQEPGVVGAGVEGAGLLRSWLIDAELKATKADEDRPPRPCRGVAAFDRRFMTIRRGHRRRG